MHLTHIFKRKRSLFHLRVATIHPAHCSIPYLSHTSMFRPREREEVLSIASTSLLKCTIVYLPCIGKLSDSSGTWYDQTNLPNSQGSFLAFVSFSYMFQVSWGAGFGVRGWTEGSSKEAALEGAKTHYFNKLKKGGCNSVKGLPGDGFQLHGSRATLHLFSTKSGIVQ